MQPRLLLGRGRRVDPRVTGRAELRRQLPIVLAGILVRAGGDLGRQQIHDRAVLVGRPHGAVVPQEAGASALLAAKAAGAVEQAGHEPLEPDGHLVEPTAELRDDAVDEATADQRLADRGVGVYVWT